MKQTIKRIAVMRRLLMLSGSRLDLILCIFLFAGCCVWGGWFLENRIHTVGYTWKFSTKWIVPSALFAEGQGFINPVPESVEGLKPFLDEKKQTFSFSSRIEDADSSTLDWFQAQHRYLLLTLGVWWRIFGVSWLTFKWLIAVYYGMSAVLLYLIFRLGLRRLLSLAATMLFMIAPVVMLALPSMRDFAKTPFIFTVLLILLYLIKEQAPRKRYYLLVLVLGLVIGAGLGFRKDLMAAIPPAAAVLAIAARTETPLRLKGRAAALTLFLASVFLMQIPLMMAPGADKGGAKPAHDIICGFATENDAALGMQCASYERVYQFWDAFTHAAGNSWGRRVLDIEDTIYYNSIESTHANNGLVLAMMGMFPGDMLARGYAAASRILGGEFARTFPDIYPEKPVITALSRVFRPLASVLEWSKFLLISAFLIVLSAWSPRRAWAVFFLILYFTGYTCLQFQVRHYFYLTFIPIGLLGFLVERGLRLVSVLIKRRRDLNITEIKTPFFRSIPLRRMALFAFTAAALLVLPLFLGRLWQERALRSYIAACLQAPRTELAVDAIPEQAGKEEGDKENVLFRLSEPVISRRTSYGLQAWDVQTEYFMAEFAPSAAPRTFRIVYDAETEFNDFSHPIHLIGAPESREGLVRYFFPVYQACYTTVAGSPNPYTGFDGRWGRSLFAGLEIPGKWAGDFKGLYRVTDLDPFGVLLNIEIPPDLADFRYYQRFRLFTPVGTTPGS
jgi:hypothetical protein